MFGAVGALVLILIAVACSRSEDQNPPQGELTLAGAILDLSSPDPAKRQAAESAVLALPPHSVEGLRQMRELLTQILGMHDKLVASADETKRLSTVKREATEAIEYFASKGAVPYLTLGLTSDNLDVQVRTALALASLDPQVKQEHRYFLVSTLAAFLETWPLPWGSETATIGRRIQQILTHLLAELIGVDPEQEGTDGVVAGAKEWLKAQGAEDDAPAGEGALGDEEPPKEE